MSVGVIITRCDDLQDIFNALGRGASYGMATTHMSKLIPRIEGGASGGCPVLVFGIRKNLYDDTEEVEPEVTMLAETDNAEDGIAGGEETNG